jgi:hypothetical protein
MAGSISGLPIPDTSGTSGGSISFGPVVPVTPVPDNYAQTFGDGVTLTFPITHNLGSLDTISQLYNPITGVNIPPTAYTATHTSPTVTTFTFLVAPALNAARAVIDR